MSPETKRLRVQGNGPAACFTLSHAATNNFILLRGDPKTERIARFSRLKIGRAAATDLVRNRSRSSLRSCPFDGRGNWAVRSSLNTVRFQREAVL
jgi:hypothetical protein